MRTTRLSLFASLLLFGACGGDHPGPGADRPEPSDELGACCGTDPSLCPSPSPCVATSTCRGANDDVGDRFPGGFCTMACAKLEDCPEGTVCVDTHGDRDPKDGYCVYPCATSADCDIASGGTGYLCLRKWDFEGSWYYVCMGR